MFVWKLRTSCLKKKVLIERARERAREKAREKERAKEILWKMEVFFGTNRYRLCPGSSEVEGVGLHVPSHYWVTKESHHHQREEGEEEEKEGGGCSPPTLRRQRRCDVIMMSS